jgi:hypothetical protein
VRRRTKSNEVAADQTANALGVINAGLFSNDDAT